MALGLTATPTSEGVALRWSRVSRATKYRVKRGGDRIATVKDGTAYLDPDPPAGGVYEVAAMTDSGRILETDTATAGTPVPEPEPEPTPEPGAFVLVVLVQGADVGLSWTSPSSDAVRYRVRRDGDPIATTTLLAHADAPGTGTYQYDVTAFDSAGNRVSRSPAVSVTVGDVQPEPEPEPEPPPGPGPTPSPDDLPWGIVGGQGRERIEVRTVAELKAAVSRGSCYVLPIGDAAWGLGGALTVSRPYVTIDVDAHRVALRDGAVKVTTGQVVLKGLRARSGDMVGDASAIDSITLNGEIDGVAILRSEAIWGPDVSFVVRPVGAGVRRVYIADSIIGRGLFRSRHAEANQDADGHSLSANIVGDIDEVRFERVLVMGSQGRQPRVIMARRVEFLNCAFYDYHEGPSGNPGSLHLLGCLWRRGPSAAKVGLRPDDHRYLFRFQASASYGGSSPIPRSVWIDDPRVEGFALAGDVDKPEMRAPGPIFPVARPAAPSSATAGLVALAGPLLADSVTAALRSDFVNGTGSYVDGGSWPPGPTRG